MYYIDEELYLFKNKINDFRKIDDTSKDLIKRSPTYLHPCGPSVPVSLTSEEEGGTLEPIHSGTLKRLVSHSL